MAMIDGMLKTLISMLGITPAQAQQAVGAVTNAARELDAVKADREAFKRASGEVIGDLWKRLDTLQVDCGAVREQLNRIEGNQKVIMMMLANPESGFESAFVTSQSHNGADNHG